MGKFKNDRYLISNIMMDKKKLSMILIIWIFIIFILFLIINIITQQREVAIITINNNSIENIQFGFQTITLMQSFSNPIPKGDLRLNYGIKDNNLDEIFSVGDYQNIGSGYIIMTNLKFPENNIWEARFELKDKNLILLDKKCSLVKFQLNNGVIYVSQESCTF